MEDLPVTADEPPGPRGWTILKWLYRLGTDAVSGFSALLREFGPFVRVPRSPSRSIFFLADPDDVQHVLQDRHRDYRKSETYDYLRPVVGNGLLTSGGDFWLRQRRLVAPMFHRDRVRTFAQMMIDTTRERLDEWADLAGRRATIDVASEMTHLTLSIAGKALFGRDIGRESREVGKAVDTLFHDVERRMISPLPVPRWIPTPNNLRVRDALQTLDRIVTETIDRRRGRAEDFDDLLSMLMLAEYEDTGDRMEEQQVRDEIKTFMLAGHETTSNALTWTLYLLSQNPSHRLRLETDVDEVLASDAPQLEELSDIEYLEPVIDESTRLFPPVWTIEREPTVDDVIRGHHIPEGSFVVAAPFLVHRNPAVWSDPERFDPERFLPGADRPDHRYAHFPFGGGPRKCVGAHFAMMEAKIILTMITRRFRLEAVSPETVEPEGTVTLYPRDGLEMRVEPR